MNCGIIQHDNECLCDIVVSTPTGWISDAVQDMWLGQEIVNLKGYTQDVYTNEWTDVDILNYLQDLVYVKDNWDHYKDTPRGIREDRTPRAIQLRVREQLASMNPPSIMKAMENLGITYETLRNSLFLGKGEMTPERLQEFEQDVLNRNFPTAFTMGEKYNMDARSVRRLHSYWGVPWGDQPTRVPASRKLMDKLITEQPDLTDKQITKMVKEQCGQYVGISRYIVKARRQELQNQN